MIEIAYGAFVGTFTVLAAIFWLARIDNEIKKQAPSGDGVLSTSPAYKRFVIAVTTLAIVALSYIFRIELDTTELLVLYSFALLAICFILQLVADSFLRVSLDDEGLHGLNRLHQKTTIKWNDIVAIEFSTTFNVFIVKGGNKSIRFSRYCLGLYHMLGKITEHSPEAPSEFVSNFIEKNHRE